jgi:16S rRNA (guanine966-N2)-methyltransferase
MRIIAGRWKGRRLKPLRGKGTRPTTDRVRESWMAAVGPALEGAVVLDLFAGSGALGLEALSRGAKSAVFVERSRGALSTLRANIELLEAGSQTRVTTSDAMAFVDRLEGVKFDVAFADPPYGFGLALRLLEAFVASPFASQLWVEHRTTDPISDFEGLRQRRYGDTVLSILEAKP